MEVVEVEELVVLQTMVRLISEKNVVCFVFVCVLMHTCLFSKKYTDEVNRASILAGIDTKDDPKIKKQRIKKTT